MYHPPDYIDNTIGERRLEAVLQAVLTQWGEKELDIASGFFEPGVWTMLGEAIKPLSRFRLLLGRAPEIEGPQDDDGVIDLRRFYRDRLRTDLETLPFNRDYAHLIDELVAFLQQEHVDVRFYSRSFLHAKAYLMPNIAIVGSSNFTPSGMTRRAELNLVQQNRAVIRDLRQNWFEIMWGEAEDQKATLVDTLLESKFGGARWTPHDVFIKVLYEYFRDRILPEAMETRLGVELASFQQEGLREAIRLIDRHGGVIVSDAVGLGKTYIGMGLLEHYVLGKRRKGFIPKGLVVCPAQLRDLVWEPKLDEYGIKCDVVSQEAMSREDFPWRDYNNHNVVLIDESHNFRNPGTGRYSNLLKLLSTGSPKMVILMTATPINNSVWDLYNQVSFITRGQDTFFREFGIRNLRGFFREVAEGSADIFTLLEQVMVRRSRQDVKQRQAAGEEIRLPGKGIIHFPDRHLHSIDYDLETTYDGFYEKIVQRIDNLALISFNIAEFRKADGDEQEVQRERQYSSALIGILKTLYLKRLESSLAAFEVSIRRQQQFQERFYNLLVNHERLLDPATNRRLLALEAQGDEVASDIDALIATLNEADIREYDLKALRRELERDMKALDAILNMIELAQNLNDERKRDAKLTQVKALLGDELRGRKVLIFSYYRDTAEYVYQALCDDDIWQQGWERPPVIATIHGGIDGKLREKLVRRFAPDANSVEGEASPISEAEPEIDILIATDVLSEGQNLQDAGVIINYDLHWTPIRMIQRAGRIDRLGSPFAELSIYNCFPQSGLESLLGLVQRLQDRIRDIDRTVGLDASVLGETISTRSLEQLRRLRSGDVSLIDDLERDDELVSTDEMKFPLMLYLQQMGMDRVRSIPRGIGSGIARSPRPSGVFFAFQAGDRHFWRLYANDGEIISDKRRLFRYLSVTPDEPRVMQSGFEVYDLLDKATHDVLKELESAMRARQQLPRKLGAINLELSTALQQASLFETIPTDEEAAGLEILRTRILHILQNVPLEAFKRDRQLKVIREEYKQTQDQKRLIHALDEFLVENELFRDIPQTRSTQEMVKVEDLQLVAYEVFG
ncbi:MAG: helicase-related protein [Chloroflexota bacterium]|nr:helicase-related protein [Chloroflexota bacterium]